MGFCFPAACLYATAILQRTLPPTSFHPDEPSFIQPPVTGATGELPVPVGPLRSPHLHLVKKDVGTGACSLSLLAYWTDASHSPPESATEQIKLKSRLCTKTRETYKIPKRAAAYACSIQTDG